MPRIITIAREYGSGGRLIAQKVAEKVGLFYYDNEVIDLAAKEKRHPFMSGTYQPKKRTMRKSLRCFPLPLLRRQSAFPFLPFHASLRRKIRPPSCNRW